MGQLLSFYKFSTNLLWLLFYSLRWCILERKLFVRHLLWNFLQNLYIAPWFLTRFLGMAELSSRCNRQDQYRSSKKITWHALFPSTVALPFYLEELHRNCKNFALLRGKNLFTIKLPRFRHSQWNLVLQWPVSVIKPYTRWFVFNEVSADLMTGLVCFLRISIGCEFPTRVYLLHSNGITTEEWRTRWFAFLSVSNRLPRISGPVLDSCRIEKLLSLLRYCEEMLPLFYNHNGLFRWLSFVS